MANAWRHYASAVFYAVTAFGCSPAATDDGVTSTSEADLRRRRQDAGTPAPDASGQDASDAAADSDSGTTSLDPLAAQITTQIQNGQPLASVAALNANCLNDPATIARIGFRRVRLDTYWENIETAAGSYDWSSVDDLWAGARDHGLTPLWILSYGNPLYGGYPTNGTVDSAFAKYAVALAQHLPPGQQFEIYNEWHGPEFGGLTPTNFAALTHAVAPAIKAADPSSLVVAGAAAGWFDLDTYEQAAAAGAYDVSGIDALAFHVYQFQVGYDSPTSPANGQPEQLLDPTRASHGTLTDFEDLEARHGLALPLWATEGGYALSELSLPPVSASQPRQMQAIFQTRYLLAGWMSGLSMINVFSDCAEDYSVLDNSLSVSALTTLFAQASGRVITGYALAQQGPESTALNLVRMQGPTDVTYVAWVRAQSSSLSLPSGAEGWDMYGNPLVLGSSVTVAADEGPIYLRFAN